VRVLLLEARSWDRDLWSGTTVAWTAMESGDPKSAPPHNNLGNALVDQGIPEEAVAECRKNIELDPKSATPSRPWWPPRAGKRLTCDEA
jgi:hypothetical protein